jgi:hypothetical protein
LNDPELLDTPMHRQTKTESQNMMKRINFHRVLGGAAFALVMSCGVSSLTASPYSTAVQADHPIAYWQLNETSGTIAHDIAGTFNGTYTNALVGQPGYTLGSDPAALAASFGNPAGQTQDSDVGGIALDLASGANTAFSAEAWVNGSGQMPGAGIVGKGPSVGEEFYLDCGGPSAAFRFFVRNAAGTAFNANSTVVPDGNWHHLVGVCDEVNGTLSLYVDGQLKASTAVSGGIRTSVNPFMNIGSRQSAATGAYDDQFSGSISDVAIYNYALSSAQIQNHYFTAGIPPIITLQPPDALTTNEGSAVTLSGAAYGTPPLSYQWTLNGVPLPGETTAIFSTNSIPGSYNGGGLYLTVTNLYGSASSAGTYVTVYSGAPQITSDVQPPQLALYQGVAFTYSVGAQGTAPFSYQWLKNGVTIAGATGSAYTVITPAGTNAYSVSVSNNFGGGSVTTSSSASLAGVALPVGTFANTILSDHPIAYWRLDDPTNSTTASEFAGGHIGTYNSAQLGVPGYSPLFDTDTAAGFGSLSPTDSYVGENDNSAAGIPLIEFGKPAGANAQFSVEAWINGPAGQNSSGSAIVAKGVAGSDEFVLDASAPGGNFRFYTRKPTGNSTSAIFSSSAPDGNWHHLVAVCDEASGSTSLYVDGVNAGTITGLGGSGLASSTTPISIGAQNNGGGYVNQFVGTIDDVAIYNYALTPGQVLAHYNAAPLPPYFTVEPPTNVLAYIGQSVTLSASALGSAPMTNQWYSNNIAMAGQTNISFTVNTSHTGTNTYTLKVSNAFGLVTSTGSVIQIPAGSGPPQLVTDIAPTSTARYANQSLTFSVTASGSSPLSYRWKFNGAVIAGATNSSYSITNLQALNAGDYVCVVSNSISTITSSTSTLTIIPPPTGTYPLSVLQDHPVAYFRLDETNGSAIGYDFVGGNNGQYTALQPNQLPQLGVAGYSPAFDTNTACKFGIGGGSVFDNYLGNTITNITFAKPNGQSGAFSVEAWVNGTAGVSQDGGACIVAKGQGGAEQFALDANNGFRFYVRNAAGVTLFNAQASRTFCGNEVGSSWQMDGNWHHLVGVCDQVNSNLLLYVDGQLIGPNVITNGVVPKLVYALDLGQPGTGTNGAIATGAGINETTITTANENSISIGNRNKNSGHVDPGGAYDLPFQGSVDEVALYDYALTPAQVYGHYAVAQGLPIPLTLQIIGGKPVLTWTTTSVLQSATNLNGPWTAVAGATSPYTVTTTGAQQFYRLKEH